MFRRPYALAVSFLLLAVAWIMLSSTLQYQEIIAGILIALAISMFLLRFLPKGGSRNIWKRTIMFAFFIILFSKEMVIANLDVAYRVLHPRIPIRPGIIRLRPGIKSELGKLVLANSITLTPGTLSVDYIGDDLYVHWINVRPDHEESIRSLKEKVKEVFR